MRDVISQPLEKCAELFPEAYEHADVIEDEVPPAPGWWWAASIGAVIVAAGIWVLMFVWAGSSPENARGVVERQLEVIESEPLQRFDIVENTDDVEGGAVP